VHLQSPKSPIGGVLPQLPNWDGASRELSQETILSSHTAVVRHIVYSLDTNSGICTERSLSIPRLLCVLTQDHSSTVVAVCVLSTPQ
jgi:hypothetical protein